MIVIYNNIVRVESLFNDAIFKFRTNKHTFIYFLEDKYITIFTETSRIQFDNIELSDLCEYKNGKIEHCSQDNINAIIDRLLKLKVFT